MLFYALLHLLSVLLLDLIHSQLSKRKAGETRFSWRILPLLYLFCVVQIMEQVYPSYDQFNRTTVWLDEFRS